MDAEEQVLLSTCISLIYEQPHHPFNDSTTILIHHLSAATRRDQMLQWAVCFLRWACDMYECSCFCCFEDLPAAAACFLLPSPKSMGVTKDEFDDWSNVVTSLARKRSGGINRDIIPRVKKMFATADSEAQLATAVEDALLSCWNVVVVMNMEIVNILLFYISYPVRNKGEPFIRAKLQQVRSGLWGSSRTRALLTRLPGTGSPVLVDTKHASTLLIGEDELRSRVADIMRFRSGGECLGICPLISIRLLQFTHGTLQHIADISLDKLSSEPLNQVFSLDMPGIDGLQKVLR